METLYIWSRWLVRHYPIKTFSTHPVFNSYRPEKILLNREEEMPYLPVTSKPADRLLSFLSSGQNERSNQFRHAALDVSTCFINGFFGENA